MLASIPFRIRLRAVLFAFALSCAQVLTAQKPKNTTAPPAADERIRVGDVFEVTVYKHPEFSGQFTVCGDGNFTLPLKPEDSSEPRTPLGKLIRDLRIAGLPRMELLGLLRDKLAATIPGSQLTLTLINSFSMPLPPSNVPSLRLGDTPSPEVQQANPTAR